MSKLRMIALAGGLVCVWVVAGGCVSRDEYLRVDFARRKALERADQMERELEDCRNRAMALEKERASLQHDLDVKTALAETLQAEVDRLDALRKRLQEQLAAAGRLGEIQVVEVKLPPALDQALKDFAAKYPDTVEYDPLRGAVRWKGDLTFALGSDEVRGTVMDALRAFAEILNSPAAQPFEVLVVGHTDNVPISPQTQKKFPTNWHLSAHRSVAVMFVLNRFGVDFRRLGVMGYGEHRPRVPNPPRGGAEANRRVEIFLVPRGEGPGSVEAPQPAAARPAPPPAASPSIKPAAADDLPPINTDEEPVNEEE